MQRKSPCIITLSTGEREKPEEMAWKYTSSYRDVIRAKIALYAAAGLCNDEIAARLDTPRKLSVSGVSRIGNGWGVRQKSRSLKQRTGET